MSEHAIKPVHIALLCLAALCLSLSTGCATATGGPTARPTSAMALTVRRAPLVPVQVQRVEIGFPVEPDVRAAIDLRTQQVVTFGTPSLGIPLETTLFTVLGRRTEASGDVYVVTMMLTDAKGRSIRSAQVERAADEADAAQVAMEKAIEDGFQQLSADRSAPAELAWMP